MNTDNYHLCIAKAAHDTVLGKIDAALTKKTLTATEATHLDTKSLIAKLYNVAKTVDLDVSTILAEQIKDLVLGTVRSWIRNGTPPKSKIPEIQQSEGVLRHCQEVDRLLIEEDDNFYDTTSLVTNNTMKTYEFVSLYRYSWHVSDLDTKTKRTETWAPQKPRTMQDDSTTGLVCSTGPHC